MIRPHSWSAVDDAVLEKAIREGSSHSEIARVLGVSKDAVWRRAKKLRIVPDDIEIPIDVDEPMYTNPSRGFSVKRLLIIPDVHAPYHDQRKLDLVGRAAKAFCPDTTISLGDLGDCWAISQHDKDPGRVMRFPEEMGITKGVVQQIGSWSEENKITLGNHEFRFPTYIAQRAPELYGLIDICDLMGLRDGGWHITPYRQILEIGKLKVTHDVKYCGATAHTRSRDKIGGNSIIGHTHRMAIDYRGNISGSRHVGAMFGWLGDLTKIDYTTTADAAEWQHGFGLGYLMPNGDIHLQPVPIVDDACVVDGQRVAA